MFIALEGVEGAGKSVQARLLEGWLRGRGLDPVVTREPGGTTPGEAARRILLESEDLAAETELLLMLAARSALVAEVIRPALEAGRVVVTDRFALSSVAYQAFGRGLPRSDVEALNRFATGGLAPDVTILLDVDPAVGAARRGGAGRDRIERAGEAFHGRVAEAYRLLAGEDERIERVDGSADPQRVHERVVALLTARFPETFPEPEG
ncbi:MAG TPA: dTMP kinase [Longimicrobiales bacterium]|nr:dTMP kinase [Longimicrobiales bacterium]